jgi:hypothetical protein
MLEGDTNNTKYNRPLISIPIKTKVMNHITIIWFIGSNSFLLLVAMTEKWHSYKG